MLIQQSVTWGYQGWPYHIEWGLTRCLTHKIIGNALKSDKALKKYLKVCGEQDKY